MEFLVIMGIGTLVAIWIVANLPKSNGSRQEAIPNQSEPSKTPAWKKPMSEAYSVHEFDYLRKLGRYQRDPDHWPRPFPPPEPPK